MDLERTLLTTPPEAWRVARAIVFDWYDGPRQGMCQLETPPGEFLFRLVAERPTADDLDDRLFRVDALPPGSVESTEALLDQPGQRTGPVWVPVWRFDTEQARGRRGGPASNRAASPSDGGRRSHPRFLDVPRVLEWRHGT